MSLVKERLLQSGIAAVGELEGCTPDDLLRLEQVAGRALPKDYLELMGELGRRSGSLVAGSDFNFPMVLSLQRSALDVVAESGVPDALDDGDFVFIMHGGYYFAVIGDDGTVGEFHVDDPQVRRKGETVSEFFLTLIDDLVRPSP